MEAASTERKTIKSETQTEETSETECPKLIGQPIEVVDQNEIRSVAFLADGEHIVGGGEGRMVRCWRVEDGKEAGPPMCAGDTICSITTSQDGELVAAGTKGGQVIVWNVASRQRISEFKAHTEWVHALDLSPDATKIASGSDSYAALVWSLSSGQPLLALCLEHNCFHVSTVKFSPDGRLIATMSAPSFQADESSLRIYDSQAGDHLTNIAVGHPKSLAWTSDSKQLFVLSVDRNIHRLDVSSGNVLSKWPIYTHTKGVPSLVSLSSDDAVIAACGTSSISFWDTATHQQLGSVISYPSRVESMEISANYDFIVAGGRNITLWDLCNILPLPYIDKRKRDEIRFRKIEVKLRDTVTELRIQLANSQRTAKEREDSLNDIIKSHRADLAALDTELNDTIVTLEKDLLHVQLENSQCKAEQKEDNFRNTINSLRADLAMQATESTKLDETIQIDVHPRSQQNTDISQGLSFKQEAERLAKILRAHHQKHQCEKLYADGHIIDAAKSLLEISKSFCDGAEADLIITDWVPEFTEQCIISLERVGDKASVTEQHDKVLVAYATALSLGPSNPDALLTKWAKEILFYGSIDEALEVSKEFNLSRFYVYRVICDTLEEYGRIIEAVSCLQQMQGELVADTSERAGWELDFRRKCIGKLQNLADLAMVSLKYNEADEYLSIILSLDTPDRVDILVKRSKARAMMMSWDDALKDADEIVELDPLSHLGYEQRRAVLHGAGRYAEAITAFDIMLSKLENSPDECVHRLRSRYVNARRTIRDIVNRTVSHMLQALGDTGQLLDKPEQEAFEVPNNFDELVSSFMTQAVKRERSI